MRENRKSLTKEQRNAAARKLLHKVIAECKWNLDVARNHGDPLQIDLAESALNSSLERLSQVTH